VGEKRKWHKKRENMEGGENAMMLNLRESNHGQQKDVGKGTEV
jgi:hypothetical protein